MILSRRACLIAIGGSLVASISARAQGNNSSMAIRGGTLIDGTGSPVRPNVIVLIRNGTVEAVGEDIKIPPDLKQLDASGRFIMPALLDSHVRIGPSPGNHTSRNEVSPEQRLESLRALLAAGVSAVRLVQGDIAEQRVYQRWQEEGVLVSPRLETSGPVFTAKGGHPLEQYSILAGATRDRELRQIASEDLARDQAREIAHAGANSFEINADQGSNTSKRPRLEKPLIEILTSEAHGHDLPVFCEVGWNQETLDAIAAGVNTIEGAWEEPFTDEVLTASVKGNTTFVPSLTRQGDLLNLLDESALKAYIGLPIVLHGLSSTIKAGLTNETGIIQTLRKELDSPDGAIIRRRLQDQQVRALSNTRKAHAAGVKIAVGTGAGNLLIFPGASVHRELQLLVKAGLTPMEAIVAATRNTAESMGLSSELGTIEPGKKADLLILDADPLLDIQNTQKIHTVVQRGREVSSEDLRVN